MAKYVIAGKSDCPYYAKAELLADELHERLNDFKVHKVVVSPDNWDEWVNKTCSERNWAYHGRSPLIWRELIDRGGKGILVGSCNDFLEIAAGYYGLKSEKSTNELQQIAAENKEAKVKDDEIAEKAKQKRSNPLKICITSAGNGVCYHLPLALCNRRIFPDVEDISICLLAAEDELSSLQGLCMEVTDSSPDQLKDVFATSSAEIAFTKANVIIILDTLDYGVRGDTSNDQSYQEMLQQIDFSKMKEYGEIIGNMADENVKVLVVGGPSNIVCNILIAASGKKKSNSNFYTLARFDENKAKNHIAKRLNVKTADIENVIIWGQPNHLQLIDANLSRVIHYDGAIWGPHIPGFSQDTRELVHNEEWLVKELPELTLQSDLALYKLRGGEPSLAISGAVLEQLDDINNGSKSDNIYSIGIASKGWYDIPEGLVFSVPVRFNAGKVDVISDIQLPEGNKNSMKEMAQQLKTITDEILKTYGLSIQ